MASIKFSSLPAHVRNYVLNEYRVGKKMEAVSRMRYYVENGYASAEQYRQAVELEAPTTAEIRSLIIDAMKHFFQRSGQQDWMRAIPNHNMICLRHMENIMLSKAGK